MEMVHAPARNTVALTKQARRNSSVTSGLASRLMVSSPFGPSQRGGRDAQIPPGRLGSPPRREERPQLFRSSHRKKCRRDGEEPSGGPLREVWRGKKNKTSQAPPCRSGLSF